MPDAVLIAGPNGAGKTTFARQVLRLWYPGGVFLNADEIQQAHPTFAHPVAAGREVLRRMASLEAYARRFAKWSGLGYRTTLHFIELPSADYVVERVAQRVAAGGHSVPEADVRRRFTRGLLLFEQVFKPLPTAGTIG